MFKISTSPMYVPVLKAANIVQTGLFDDSKAVLYAYQLVRLGNQNQFNSAKTTRLGWPYVCFSPDMPFLDIKKNVSGRDFQIAQNIRDSAFAFYSCHSLRAFFGFCTKVLCGTVFLIPLPLNFWPLLSDPANILMLNIKFAHQGAAINLRSF